MVFRVSVYSFRPRSGLIVQAGAAGDLLDTAIISGTHRDPSPGAEATMCPLLQP